MDCELCGVFEHEKSRVVYTDDHVWVMMNNRPLKRGHVNILPKRHAENLVDLTPDEAAAFLRAIDKAMSVLKDAYNDEAPILIVNSSKYRSQIHLHAHVLPAKHGLRGLFQNAENLPAAPELSLFELTSAADELRPFFKDLPA